MHENTPAQPSFTEALKFWLKLGFISFGGPAGQIGIMHEYLVSKKKWISDSRFLHALNYCMLLPGPEAQQLATYTGWLLHGVKGGLAAGILFVLPSAFILWALSMAYVTYGKLEWVQALFAGLKPAVVAIIIMALVKIGKKSLKGTLHYLIATCAFIAIYFFHVSFVLILLTTIIVAFAIQKVFPQFIAKSKKAENTTDSDEQMYYLNKHSAVELNGYNKFSLLKLSVVFALLWLLPLLAVYLLHTDFAFWKTLTVFFTKAALVTFGGAYAVLPYVAQVSVEKLQWLTSLQMIDGLALGETTPGPLIIILSFVGFMAGYNHYSASLLFGTAGLFVTTYYTFLPCFFFILAGAPIVEKTRGNAMLNEVMSFITSAVVGVLLNLTIYLTKAVVLKNTGAFSFDILSVVWIVISVIALWRFNLNMMVLIAVSALFGASRYLLHV